MLSVFQKCLMENTFPIFLNRSSRYHNANQLGSCCGRFVRSVSWCFREWILCFGSLPPRLLLPLPVLELLCAITTSTSVRPYVPLYPVGLNHQLFVYFVHGLESGTWKTTFGYGLRVGIGPRVTAAQLTVCSAKATSATASVCTRW